MKTAFEMADFILNNEVGPEIKFTSVAKAREKRRHYLADLFRPIEQTLKATEDDDAVLYAITSRGMTALMKTITDIDLTNLEDNTLNVNINNTQNAIRAFQYIPTPANHHDVNVAAVFTANRCIITHTEKTIGVPIKTILYDNIINIEECTYTGITNRIKGGGITLNTTTNDGSITFRTQTVFVKGQCLYRQFVPEQTRKTVMELLTKYKQAKTEGQNSETAPQKIYPQTARQPVPQGSQATSPTAPTAKAGLSVETVETLKQFKELLDAEIITQEEFDAKKKQLLGL